MDTDVRNEASAARAAKERIKRLEHFVLEGGSQLRLSSNMRENRASWDFVAEGLPIPESRRPGWFTKLWKDRHTHAEFAELQGLKAEDLPEPSTGMLKIFKGEIDPLFRTHRRMFIMNRNVKT